jgi:hypothetical protein
MKRKSILRRAVLASLVVAAFAGPALGSGCGGGFPPISQVSGLRVLAVQADKPYAQPGDTVTFTMTYSNPPGAPAPQILWLGGCVNPPSDTYYGCYADAGLASGEGLIAGEGPTFTMKVPESILTPPATQGTAFVFFAVCDGSIVVDAGGAGGGTSGGLAGAFPIGCLGANNQLLSADAFVPGYTQVYAFSDGRTNNNPPVNGISINQVPNDAGVADGGNVTACPVPEGARIGVAGCGSTDPFTQCQDDRAEYQITVDVPLDDKSPTGLPQYELVWVDYFADQGDMDTPTSLIVTPSPVSDAGPDFPSSFSTNWIAPPAPTGDAGPLAVNIWAVVHDNRGGETVAHEVLHVR